MPAAEKRILSTRPLDAALLELASGKDIIIDVLSFIDTEPVREEHLDHQVRELGGLPLTAVFTSMNAVEAVAKVVKEPVWKIFCIGAATQQLVRQHFGSSTIAGTAASAMELSAVIIKEGVAETFFFCGDSRRDELPDALSAAGVRVNELVVYRTKQTPHVVEQVYEGIAFFSPSAVHSYFSMNVIADKTVLFAIGQTTAGAIRIYTDNPIILSETPEKATLVRQIIDYFQTNI